MGRGGGDGGWEGDGNPKLIHYTYNYVHSYLQE